MNRKRLCRPNHPNCNGDGHVFEHIVIAEDSLGKYLNRSHPVHHIDENKLNNSRNNLVICEDKRYHMLLHQRTKALLEFGTASATKCVLCNEYIDDPSEAYHWMVSKTGTNRSCHKICAALRRKGLLY